MDESIETMETEGESTSAGEKDNSSEKNSEAKQDKEESGMTVKENCDAGPSNEKENTETDKPDEQSANDGAPEEEGKDEEDKVEEMECESEIEKDTSHVEKEIVESEKNKDVASVESDVAEGGSDSNKENLNQTEVESQTKTNSAPPSELPSESSSSESVEEDKPNEKNDEENNKSDEKNDEENNKSDEKKDEENKSDEKNDEENNESDDKTSSDKQIDEVGEIDGDSEKSKVTDSKEKDNEDDEEIIELEVYKKPAEFVDLSIDDESEVDKEKEVEKDPVGDDQSCEGSNRGIKLRSLASLVENESQEKNDDNSSESTISAATPLAEAPAIGEIIEHGEIIGSAEMGGLQLRISNVVGGEDSITGLSTDEDRDVFCNIQISSVTTLMDPMSPEDPNKDKDISSEKSAFNDHSDETGKDGDEGSTVGGIKIVNSESLANKESGKEEGYQSEDGKIRHSSALSEEGKDDGTAEDDSNKNTFHVLKSILTVTRICQVCKKAAVCEFRVKQKFTQGAHCFLCSLNCKNRWIESLPSDHVVEKARLIFEKLCGMCGKDLTALSRKNQFSWETREFCTQNCLTLHLNEVAGKCHTCRERVRHLFIGKYCVRFGSDIHQFCSNTCLEYYKTKIKVCCYCQKNLEKVNKVTSTANKEYCSTKCLKRTQRRDIGQQNYNEKYACTVCQAEGVNRYEFMLNAEPFPLCSDPCLNVYKYVNKVKAVACCLCFRMMNAEEVCRYLWHGGHQLRVFCSDSCVNVFILSARKIVVCDTCKVKKYNFDMIHKQIDEEFLDLFYCSLNCLKTADLCPRKSLGSGNSTVDSSTNTSNNTSTTASESSVTPCNMCSTIAKAQFHMVMSDNTLRSFCRYACATKFKSTFGFQVDGVQTTSTQQSAKSAPLIRAKQTSQLTADPPETTENSSEPKKKNGISSPETTLNTSIEDLLKLLTAPKMVNKMTSCQPMQSTKGVYCKPHPWHRETQTESTGDPKVFTSDPPPILPVPVPVYVPSPMMMYNAPCPVPIFVPIPLPVPIFIPTTAKTSEDIKEMMKKITEEMPSDPYEAEMLLLARAEKGKEINAQETEENEENTREKESESTEVTSVDNFNEFPEEEAVNDLETADVSCLNTVEEDLPVYPLRILGSPKCTSKQGDTESLNNRGKRKVCDVNSGRARKRLRRTHSNDSQSLSEPDDPDPEAEAEAEPEAIIEEEYQGPYLNVSKK